ncbi:hypothetical protein ACHWQZ_G018477 [Mnemiopsis leidyi]
MVMGGFSIEDILSTPHKRDQKKDQKKDQRSNYQRNLSHAPYSAFDLSFSSDAYKAGYKKNVGIAMPLQNYKPMMNQSKMYNDKPTMMHSSQKTEGFRPPSSGGTVGGWPNTSSSSIIPQHKRGQVEATRKSKPRKTQTVFSSHQLAHLDSCYRRHNYITTEERNVLAENLQMSVPQVKNWFQNKRNKEKKLGNHPNRNNMHLQTAPYHSMGPNLYHHHDIGLGPVNNKQISFRPNQRY